VSPVFRKISAGKIKVQAAFFRLKDDEIFLRNYRNKREACQYDSRSCRLACAGRNDEKNNGGAKKIYIIQALLPFAISANASNKKYRRFYISID